MIIATKDGEPTVERESLPPTPNDLGDPIQRWMLVRADLSGGSVWLLGRLAMGGSAGSMELENCVELGVQVGQGPPEQPTMPPTTIISRTANPLMLLSTEMTWVVHQPLLSTKTAEMPEWARAVIAKQAARAWDIAKQMRFSESGLVPPPNTRNGPYRSGVQ